MLRSDLCYYSNACIVIKGTITLLAAAANEYGKEQKDVTFKNNAPFRQCVSKINSTLIDNVEDLDIVILMHNLLEYSGNYSMTSGSSWNYYRDKVGGVNDNASEFLHLSIRQNY